MNAYVVAFESWLDDKQVYTYANICAFTTKEAADAEADRRNEQIEEDNFDSYFVDEIGLFE